MASPPVEPRSDGECEFGKGGTVASAIIGSGQAGLMHSLPKPAIGERNSAASGRVLVGVAVAGCWVVG